MDLLPTNWTGPIVVRSPRYLRSLRDLLLSHSNRVIHNSLILLFALETLPPGQPTPLVCTKATVNYGLCNIDFFPRSFSHRSYFKSFFYDQSL